MALKAVLDKVDDLPEPVKKEYTLKDGKYYLQLEGDVPGFVAKAAHDEQLTKLTEFRENNRALNTKVTDLDAKLKTFEGVDPAEYKTLKSKLTAAGAGDGDVAKLVAAAVDPLLKKLETLETTNKQSAHNLAIKELESTLKDAAIKAGVDEKMMGPFIDYAKRTFVLDENGKVVPKKGDTPIYSPKKPAEMITAEEWATLQVAEVPGFFKQSSGGGAGGPGGGGPRIVAGKTVISGMDPLEFGKNLEGIAKGTTLVQP